MVKRYYGGVISATQISPNITAASGFYNTNQQMQAKQANNWPYPAGVAVFSISPAYTGKSTWDLAVDGPLTANELATFPLAEKYIISTWNCN